MTRGRTLAWLALLVGAVALIVWQVRHPTVPTVDEDDKLGAFVVTAPYEQWAAIELLHRGERVRFERDAAGAWFRHDAVDDKSNGQAGDHAHRVDAASAERLGTAFSTFSRARVERSMTSDPTRLAGYGLVNPALIVLVLGRDGRVLQTLEMGEVAPDRLSRYVHLPQTRSVHTIANYQASGLLALLAAPTTGP